MIQKRNSTQSNNKQQQSHFNITQAISILQRKHYGCLSKVFCCKCFYCCQDFDFTLLTSKNRKGAFQQMVKKYLKSMHSNTHSKTNVIMDPFFILVALLLGQQSQIYNQLLEQVSNANQTTIFSKQDLQFYIPQLCTYLVFHQQMSNAQLSTFLQRACKVDLHFSLRYYFFMKSLQMIQSTYEIKKLPMVQKYNSVFRNKVNLFHKNKNNKRQRKMSFGQNLVTSSQSQQDAEHDNTISKIKQQLKDECNLKRANSQLYRKDSFSSQCSSQFNDQQTLSNRNDLDMCYAYNVSGKSFSGIQKPTYLNINQIYTMTIKKSNQHYPLGLFESTVNFFFDLVHLSQILLKIQLENRFKAFQSHLDKIKTKLPSVVYLPFTKNQYQGMTILNIINQQSRVFKTKERAPFNICVQTFYNPMTSEQSSRQKKIKSTMRSSKNLKRSVLFQQDIQIQIQGQNMQSQIKNSNQALQKSVAPVLKQKQQKNLRDSGQSTMGMTQKSKKNINFKQIKKNIWGKLFQLKKLIKDDNSTSRQNNNQRQNNSDRQGKSVNSSIQKNVNKTQENVSKTQDQNISENQSNVLQNQSQKQDFKQNKSMIVQQTINYDVGSETYQQKQYKIFGKSQNQKFNQIAQKSPYSKLPGYKIINFIVKSNDDLRQQCFAMQLLYQFQRIFVMEKLKIKLCPYQVMPLSHNSGIIQFISQAITMDQLIKKQGNLLFVRQSKQKLKNFIHSLAGYSLVTYMLQVKDRHNQNIMIKRDGTIIHIDYGFFLSNMPGKGVQLQKKVPFKLTSQYIQALGGITSKQFAYFRKLFYQGFNALRKHQHRILILTKLMYSSYGTTMKCFEKGDQAIQKLVNRFNPKNVRTDGQLSLFCQNLVNDSIQNWRAKWYDRWQYFAQGIVY